jgi:hypothetical protein
MATSPPRKKPVGGVSMFGGMDPMAALKGRNRSESSKGSDPGVKVEEDEPKVKVEEKTEVKVEEKIAPPSPPAGNSIISSLCQKHFDKLAEPHFRRNLFYLIKQILYNFRLGHTKG